MSTIQFYSVTERSNWVFRAEQDALTANKSKSSQVPQTKASLRTGLYWDVYTINTPCFNCTAMSMNIGEEGSIKNIYRVNVLTGPAHKSSL